MQVIPAAKNPASWVTAGIARIPAPTCSDSLVKYLRNCNKWLEKKMICYEWWITNYVADLPFDVIEMPQYTLILSTIIIDEKE